MERFPKTSPSEMIREEEHIFLQRECRDLLGVYSFDMGVIVNGIAVTVQKRTGCIGFL